MITTVYMNFQKNITMEELQFMSGKNFQCLKEVIWNWTKHANVPNAISKVCALMSWKSTSLISLAVYIDSRDVTQLISI